MISMAESTNCLACGQDRAAHENLNHQFSLDGTLKPRVVAVPHRIQPGEAMAARLAVVLHAAGILTDDQMEWVLTGRPDVSPGRRLERDSSPGPQSETKRDMRGSFTDPVAKTMDSGNSELERDPNDVFRLLNGGSAGSTG